MIAVAGEYGQACELDVLGDGRQFTQGVRRALAERGHHGDFAGSLLEELDVHDGAVS